MHGQGPSSSFISLWPWQGPTLTSPFSNYTFPPLPTFFPSCSPTSTLTDSSAQNNLAIANIVASSSINTITINTSQAAQDSNTNDTSPLHSSKSNTILLTTLCFFITTTQAKFDCYVSRTLCGLWNHWQHLLLCCSSHINPFVAFSTPGKLSHGTHLHSTWDTDLFKTGINSQTSCTMSLLKATFCKFHPSCAFISGIVTASLQVCSIGTFVSDIKDDTSHRHIISIQDSLFVPGLQYTLLCPQHWVQTAAPGLV